MPDFVLLPQPRQLEILPHLYVLQPNRLILLDGPQPSVLRFTAQRFQAALQMHRQRYWQLAASTATPPDQVGLALHLSPERFARPQGYELTIGPATIDLTAGDEAGLFYGVCTLIQLLQTIADPAALPGLHIVDWPDFAVRGVMLDISRDRVPTLETTLALVDRLASWKINQFQLYTEHTFAYRRHPEVWAAASPFTGEEILQLDAYCRERYIDLVPNQNSFGHMHHWLEHDRYRPLAEAPAGFDFPWGEHSDGPFSLCPIDPGSLELAAGLFDELLPYFSSKQLNVGCDETFDVGQGRSRAECDRLGTGRVYLTYLLKVYQAVAERNHVMQFWGDIIVQYPELVPELPRDAVALEWGYEADHAFDAHCAQFAQAGLPFYVCPGTSSWTSIAGRTHNALGNLHNAAQNGLKHGASGYLITDWGDKGHWQSLPVSYLGWAMGAAFSWGYEANRAADVPRVVSHFAFDDPTGHWGRVAYDLGNVYRATGIEPHNSSTLFWMLQWPLSQVAEGYRGVISPETLQSTLAEIDRALWPLAEAQSARADAAWLRREFEFAAHLLRHGAQRGLLAIGAPDRSVSDLERDLREIIAEYQAVWLLRYRPGGLSDSVAWLERSRRDYEA